MVGFTEPTRKSLALARLGRRVAEWAEKFFIWGQWMWGLLFLALGARFALIALERYGQQSPESIAGTEKKSAVPSSVHSTLRQIAKSLPKPSEDLKPTAKGGDVITATLSANLQPSRSEVLVDGESLGNTPFAGDFSCRLGDPVKIEIIAPSGATKQFTRPCSKGMITLRDGSE